MPNIQRAGDRNSSSLYESLSDLAMKTFQLGLVVSSALLLYLLWGLFTGKLADVANQSPAEVQQALQTIGTLSLALNVSLVVTLVSPFSCFMTRIHSAGASCCWGRFLPSACSS